MLADLGLHYDIIEANKAFTHAGTWISSARSAEMTSPHARFITWVDRLSVGDEVLIRRPCNPHMDGNDVVEIDEATGAKMAKYASADARAKLDYPEREIIRYYAWSWGIRKLTFGEKFGQIFDNDTSDVCSDSYWGYAIKSGAWPGISETDAIPAGYYPARLAISNRFVTIARVQIVGETTAKGDEE